MTSRADLLKGGESGPGAIAGKPAESLILRAVKRQVEGMAMPPDRALTAAEVQSLERWVADGLPWPGGEAAPAVTPNATGDYSPEQKSFWAFQKVTRPAPPSVKNSAWARSPLDLFVLAKLEAKGLTPAASASKEIWLRRVNFDLIGLPPTPSEIDAFLADSSAEAEAKVVDRLLASPRYGERWGPPLARRRPLRRLQRPRREHAPAQRPQVPRLGRLGVQRRPALRPIPEVATRRRPVAAAARGREAERAAFGVRLPRGRREGVGRAGQGRR